MRQLGIVIFFKEESPTFRRGENFVDKKIRKFAVSVYDICINHVSKDWSLWVWDNSIVECILKLCIIFCLLTFFG